VIKYINKIELVGHFTMYCKKINRKKGRLTLFRCAMSLLPIYSSLIWHRKKLPGKGNVSCLLTPDGSPPPAPCFLVPAKDGGERMDN
jgi:hypothetical protein